MMDKPAILRQFWRERLHTEPSALDGSGGQWRSIWEPSERLLDLLARLPAGLLAWWLRTDHGHIIIGTAASAYLPGSQEWRGQAFAGLCRVRTDDIAADNDALWGALLTCCDHLLGSAGQDKGGRFSDGRGATPRLQAAAERMQRAIALGYGVELLDVEAKGPQAYWSRAWQLYWRDPARLNVTDPLSYRVLADSLMNEAFWQLVLAKG